MAKKRGRKGKRPNAGGVPSASSTSSEDPAGKGPVAKAPPGKAPANPADVRRGSASNSSGAAGSDAAHRISVPSWLPVTLYAIVTLVLFRTFIVSGQMLYGGDTEGLGYMARAFFADALASGDFPLWNPIILGGTPFLDSLAGGDSLYPPSVLLLLLLEPFRALGWKLVLHVFLAGLLMFGWLRSLGVSRASSTVMGLAYLLAPFFVSMVYPGHDGKIFVVALTPLAFWAAEKSLARGGFRWYMALAAVIAAVILTTHFQMAYFLFGALGCYYAFRVVQVGRVRANWRTAFGRFGMFIAAALLGAGVSAVQLVPAVSYVLEHSRRTATTTEATPEQALVYSSSWSLHPEEVASLVVPEFVGGNIEQGADWTNQTYWGRNAFKTNHEYTGLLVLILAGLSFLGAPRKGLRHFFAVLGVVALLFALGRHTPIWRLFYEVVPGVSLFRVPSISIFLFGFSAVTLAAFGLDRAIVLFSESADRWKKPHRYLWAWTASLGFLGVLWASGALPAFWTGVVYGDIGARADALARATPFISRGFFVATILSAALAGALTLGRRGTFAPGVTVVLVAALIGLDGFRVDDSYILTVDSQRLTRPDANESFLAARVSETDPWRLYSINSQDVRPGTFGIELAGGHHPNDLARYRELIGMAGSGSAENLRSTVLLSLLNVRYLLWPELEAGGPPFPGASPVSTVTLADGRPYTAVYELPTLPRARLLADARVVPEEATVATILSAGFDPANEVILNEEPPTPLSGGPVEGSVNWTARGNDVHELTVTSDRDALLVIADNWYPDWKATVDGVEAPVLRAYHSLRAVPIPPGSSEVRMYFGSDRIKRALWISLASILLLVGGSAYTLLRERHDGKLREQNGRGDQN